MLLQGTWIFRGSCARAPTRIIVPPQDRAHGLLCPQHPSDGGKAVRKCWILLLVPSSAEHCERASPRGQLSGPQGHQREQAEQQRRGSVDCQIRPLAWVSKPRWRRSGAVPRTLEG